MKGWTFHIYAFFDPVPTIEYVEGRRTHVLGLRLPTAVHPPLPRHEGPLLDLEYGRTCEVVLGQGGGECSEASGISAGGAREDHKTLLALQDNHDLFRAEEGTGYI